MLESTTFTPEPPYSEKFNRAQLRQDNKNKRMYVRFYNIGSDVSDRGGTLYSRYLFQVDYWKKHGEWIPDGYHVDHINDNPFDDRLDNFQLLTPQENIRKRDEAAYRLNPISPETIDHLRILLQDGWPYAIVVEKLGLSYGHLRHLVRTVFLEFTPERIIELNREPIKDMVTRGMSQLMIANQFDLSQITISRFIRDHLPECKKDAIMIKRLAVVEDGLIKGETNIQIAKRLNMSDASICLYIQRFFPDHVEARLMVEERDRTTNLRKIKWLLDAKHTQREISQLLELSPWTVTNLVVNYLPDYMNRNAYDIRVKRVGALLKSGATRSEIVDKLDILPNVISSIINKFYREYSANTTRSETFEKFKEIVLSGKPFNTQEVADRLGVSCKTISDYLNTYFPEHTKIGRANILRDQIKTLLASTDEKLNTRQIAERLGVEHNRVKDTIGNGLDATGPKDIDSSTLTAIKKLLDEGSSLATISKQLGINGDRRMSRIVKHHFPDVVLNRTKFSNYQTAAYPS